MDIDQIFIDTSIFYTKCFNFKSKIFNHLSDAVKDRHIRVYSTDITIQEVEANIKEMNSEVIGAFKKFKKGAKTLSTIASDEIKSIEEKLRVDDFNHVIVEQFKHFLEKSAVEIIDSNQARISDVFKNYFSKQAPFGPGKKKSEFPDAFVISALTSFCSNNCKKMYVISSDTGMIKACNNHEYLVVLESIEKFFDLLSKEKEYQTTYIHRILESNRDIIIEKISAEYTDYCFDLEDQDGEVLEVDLSNLELMEFLIQDIGEKEALIYVDCLADYTAQVIYDDLDTASYDSEDKRLIVWNKIEDELQRQESFSANFRIRFNMKDDSVFEIDELELDAKRTMLVIEYEY